jgi:hypothetical protein
MPYRFALPSQPCISGFNTARAAAVWFVLLLGFACSTFAQEDSEGASPTGEEGTAPVRTLFAAFVPGLEDALETTTGYASLQTATAGAFSGVLRYGFRMYRFKGVHGATGGTIFEFGRTDKAPLRITVYPPGRASQSSRPSTTGTSTAALRIQDGDTARTILLSEREFSDSSPCALAGRYNVAFFVPNRAEEKIKVPGGVGFATFLVTPLGTLSGVGRLGDATPFSFKALAVTPPTGRSGRTLALPFYVPLYGSGGSFASEGLLVRLQPTNGVSGEARWDRLQGAKGERYKDGFKLTLTAVGTPYSEPDIGEPLVTVLGSGPFNGALTVRGGGLPSAMSEELLFPSRLRVGGYHFGFGNRMALYPASSAEPRTGIVIGSFFDAVSGERKTYQAITLQGGPSLRGVRGHFTNGKRTGRVELLPETEFTNPRRVYFGEPLDPTLPDFSGPLRSAD